MTSTKSFLALAGVTALAVALAAVLTVRSDAGGAIAGRGVPLLPDFAAKANGIGRVAVTTGGGTTTLTRAGDGFTDQSGFPARIEAVRELVSGLSTLTVEERKTDRPARYADLDLADPGAAKGAGTKVELVAADGTSIADVVLGSRDPTVGGSRGGQFVRVEGQPQTYLARGAVTLPATRSGWFETRLVAVPAADITRVTLAPRGGEPILLTREGDALALAAPPADRAPDKAKISQLASLFEGVDFTDVRKAGSAAGNGPTLAAETGAGLRVTLSEVSDGWARITAEATSDGAGAAAKAIADKTRGFEFRLAPSVTGPLGWTVQDLTTAPPS